MLREFSHSCRMWKAPPAVWDKLAIGKACPRHISDSKRISYITLEARLHSLDSNRSRGNVKNRLSNNAFHCKEKEKK